MKVFLISTEICDYDEFDAVVVIAKLKEEAMDVVENKNQKDRDFPLFEKRQYPLEVKEIDLKDGDGYILLASFNAG